MGKRVIITCFTVIFVLGCDETSGPGPESDQGMDQAQSADQADLSEHDLSGPPIPLDEPGPFRVGYRELEHTYEVLPGEPRTIAVHVWYPSNDADGTSPRYLGLFRDDVSMIEASLAPPLGARYPVHVHSHGDQGYGGTSSRIFHHFVSHGWVVIAPDHTGNTLTGNIQPRPIPLYHWRAADVRASLDFADSLSNDPLSGLLNTEKVILSGHSFGGFTSWPLVGATWRIGALEERCESAGNPEYPCTPELLDAFGIGHRDERIVASVSLAGRLDDGFFEPNLESIAVPVLSMTGTEDQIGQTEQWDRIEGIDYTWIDIEGACHQTFALGGCPILSTEEGDSLVNLYMLAFAIKHVLQVTDARVEDLLNGDEVPALVRFQKK